MTQTQKIIALAQLDGWETTDNPKILVKRFNGGVTQESHVEAQNLNAYLTSHDALQPLLEKMTEDQWLRFGNLILGQTGFHNRWFHPKPILLMSPEQKADCILKAAGAWKD